MILILISDLCQRLKSNFDRWYGNCFAANFVVLPVIQKRDSNFTCWVLWIHVLKSDFKYCKFVWDNMATELKWIKWFPISNISWVSLFLKTRDLGVIDWFGYYLGVLICSNRPKNNLMWQLGLKWYGNHIDLFLILFVSLVLQIEINLVPFSFLGYILF